ncbi:hypothetical protein DF41_15965 [Raoultella planticola]|nr:hypothetical protein DF41_15965 [Raoultella planticola]
MLALRLIIWVYITLDKNITQGMLMQELEYYLYQERGILTQVKVLLTGGFQIMHGMVVPGEYGLTMDALYLICA